MTWQRINENIYIDDSLVTCAEYQLFIDEMREQEKYYQPDHWTSYQFPEGQARQPILGVRRSDAEAFYRWLTARQIDMEWRYRLPNDEEAKPFPVKTLESTHLGYWFRQDHFAWVGPVPEDARQMRMSINYACTQSLNHIGGLHIDFDDDYLTTYQYRLDLDRASPATLVSDLTLDFALSHVLAYAYERARGQGLVLGASVYEERLRNHVRGFEHELDLDSVSGLDLALVFKRELNHILANDFDRALDLTRTCALDLPLVLVYQRDFGSARKHAAKFIVDVLTLKERIAGRSPAFEGIRLVKERIK